MKWQLLIFIRFPWKAFMWYLFWFAVPFRCPISMNDFTSYFNGKCYVPQKDSTTGEDAPDLCRKVDKEPLVITSSTEQAFLESHIATIQALNLSFSSMWIGLRQEPLGTNVSASLALYLHCLSLQVYYRYTSARVYKMLKYLDLLSN